VVTPDRYFFYWNLRENVSTSDESGLDRLRQPEYTGENRCLPCTVTNVGIAAAASVGVGLVFPPAGVAVFAVALAAIWLRGYLIPGTPELTKRYFPDRLLALFGKTPEPGPAIAETDLDPEETLLELGVIEPYEDDLRAAPEFADRWDAEIESVRTNAAAGVAALLGLDETSVSFEARGNAYVVSDDGTEVARWPSRAALLADLAAIPVLRDRAGDWEELSRAEQGQLLAGLRVFLDSCPDCDGPLSFGQETVESCCRTAEVITYDCDDCGARVMEVQG
jgi:hypothetical protein